MKNNLVYYQHYADSHQHPKFKLLRSKYGWEGEGRFWALNNLIASSEKCLLDVSKKYTVASAADTLNLTIEHFHDFINFLVDECELLLRFGDHITNDTLRENLQQIMQAREQARKRKLKQKGNVITNPASFFSFPKR